MSRSWIHHERRDELEREIFRVGEARGRLAVTLDLLTDALIQVGQHRVYCHANRLPLARPGAREEGSPELPRDLLAAREQIQGAKELVQEALEHLTRERLRPQDGS